MKMLKINHAVTGWEIYGEIDIESTEIKQKMYLRATNGEYEIAAYIYPLDKREELQKLMDDLNKAKRVYDDLEAKFLYEDLARLRTWGTRFRW